MKRLITLFLTLCLFVYPLATYATEVESQTVNLDGVELIIPEPDPCLTSVHIDWKMGRPSTVEENTPLTLTSTLEGIRIDELVLSYQWYYDKHDGQGFVPITGANSKSYSFPATAATLSYDYKLIVTYQ